MLNTAQLNSSGCQALSVLSFHMFCTFNIVSAKDRQRITQKKEKEREREARIRTESRSWFNGATFLIFTHLRTALINWIHLDPFGFRIILWLEFLVPIFGFFQVSLSHLRLLRLFGTEVKARGSPGRSKTPLNRHHFERFFKMC